MRLKIAKKSLTAIFAFQGRFRSSMLVPPKRSSAMLVMISSKSCQSATVFTQNWSIVAEIARFEWGTQI